VTGQAYIFIQTWVGRAGSVARDVAAITGVLLAEDVTGPYDVIARVEATSVDVLGQQVIGPIQDVKGITRTLTCTVVHL
jgi:DNA-binding Lrp family transcriptional regulator